MNAIVAVSENWGIGKDNALLFHIRADLQRFKALTTGHTIIMGRKTFESLPKGALPNRRNIVLSRSCREFEGAECFHTLEEALKACANEEEVFILGGASLYAEALPLTDRLYVTEVEDRLAEADAFFPALDPAQWQEKSRECHSQDEKHLYSYTFIDYDRLRPATAGNGNV